MLSLPESEHRLLGLSNGFPPSPDALPEVGVSGALVCGGGRVTILTFKGLLNTARVFFGAASVRFWLLDCPCMGERGVPADLCVQEPSLDLRGRISLLPSSLHLGVPSLGVPSLGVLSLGVPSLGVPSLGVPSLGVPLFENLSRGVPSLRVPSGNLSRGVPSRGVLLLKAPSLSIASRLLGRPLSSGQS